MEIKKELEKMDLGRPRPDLNDKILPYVSASVVEPYTRETEAENASSLFRSTGFVPVLDRCSIRCRLCSVLGCLHDEERSPESLHSHLRSIAAAGLKRATFPPNTVYYADRESISGICRQFGLIPVLRLHPAIGVNGNRDMILAWIAAGGEIEAIIDELWNEGDLELLRRLDARINTRLTALLIPNRYVSMETLLASLPESLGARAEFHFPLKNDDKDEFWDCDEIHFQLQQFRKQFPDQAIQVYKGHDLLDPACVDLNECEFEPQLEPVLKTASLNPTPEISVVIPTYNRKEAVINTLRHLQRQELSADLFEVIIVDDGSTDHTLERIREQLARSPMRFNLKYLYFSRTQHETDSGPAFRAGIARNLGVKASIGRILVFLDSDILVPPDFLMDVREQQVSADIIQYECIQIPFQKGSQRPRYQELDARKHGVRFAHRFWERLYSHDDWASLPAFWKYTNTGCLTVKREHFLTVGGFARAFRAYGFEDTYLGWKLARLNVRWRTRRKPVFHLWPAEEQSPYRNSQFRQRLLMARSAKTFYHLTIDEKFYRESFPLLGELVRTRMLMQFLGRWAVIRFLLLTPLCAALLAWRQPQRSSEERVVAERAGSWSHLLQRVFRGRR